MSNEEILLYTYEDEYGMCSVSALPELQVITVHGSCILGWQQMAQLRSTLQSFEKIDDYDRFVFSFPRVESDVAFHLAAFLHEYIFKCAFIVHPTMEKHFPQRLFWHLCRGQDEPLAYLEALKLVGSWKMPAVVDDEPVDYRAVNIADLRGGENDISGDAF